MQLTPALDALSKQSKHERGHGTQSALDGRASHGANDVAHDNVHNKRVPQSPFAAAGAVASPSGGKLPPLQPRTPPGALVQTPPSGGDGRQGGPSRVPTSLVSLGARDARPPLEVMTHHHQPLVARTLDDAPKDGGVAYDDQGLGPSRVHEMSSRHPLMTIEDKVTWAPAMQLRHERDDDEDEKHARDSADHGHLREVTEHVRQLPDVDHISMHDNAVLVEPTSGVYLPRTHYSSPGVHVNDVPSRIDKPKKTAKLVWRKGNALVHGLTPHDCIDGDDDDQSASIPQRTGESDSTQHEEDLSNAQEQDEDQSSAPQQDEDQSSAPQQDEDQSSAPQQDEDQSSAPQQDEDQSSAPQQDEDQSSAPQQDEDQSSAPQQNEFQENVQGVLEEKGVESRPVAAISAAISETSKTNSDEGVEGVTVNMLDDWMMSQEQWLRFHEEDGDAKRDTAHAQQHAHGGGDGYQADGSSDTALWQACTPVPDRQLPFDTHIPYSESEYSSSACESDNDASSRPMSTARQGQRHKVHDVPSVQAVMTDSVDDEGGGVRTRVHDDDLNDEKNKGDGTASVLPRAPLPMGGLHSTNGGGGEQGRDELRHGAQSDELRHGAQSDELRHGAQSDELRHGAVESVDATRHVLVRPYFKCIQILVQQ
jgi:hypothetical protein